MTVGSRRSFQCAIAKNSSIAFEQAYDHRPLTVGPSVRSPSSRYGRSTLLP